MQDRAAEGRHRHAGLVELRVGDARLQAVAAALAVVALGALGYGTFSTITGDPLALRQVGTARCRTAGTRCTADPAVPPAATRSASPAALATASPAVPAEPSPSATPVPIGDQATAGRIPSTTTTPRRPARSADRRDPAGTSPAPVVYTYRYVSDLRFTRSVNGWGPVERDTSNGEQLAGDGHPITVAGQRFSRGLGVHAGSDVRIDLSGRCTTFHTYLGVDDEANPNRNPQGAQLQFVVLADGRQLYRSPTLAWMRPARPLELDVHGIHSLALVVDGLGFIGHDHADWADARIRCAA